jgi:hypothetical protein
MSISHPTPEDTRKQTHEEAPREQPRRTIQSGKKQPIHGVDKPTSHQNPLHTSTPSKHQAHQHKASNWHQLLGTLLSSQRSDAHRFALTSVPTGLVYCTRTFVPRRIRSRADRATPGTTQLTPKRHPVRTRGGRPRDQPSFSAERFRCPFLPAGRHPEQYGRHPPSVKSTGDGQRHRAASTAASVRLPRRRMAQRPCKRSSGRSAAASSCTLTLFR